MTNWVSGGTCMSRLRGGTSEGESDALFGKGSGSSSRVRGISEGLRAGRCRRRRQFAKQAVALEAVDSNRQDLANDGLGRHHMRRLEIGGAADDLAWIAGRAFEQNIGGGAN